MSLYSWGRLSTNAWTSSILLTSSFTGNTLTPFARPSISLATSFKVSSLRAVRISLSSGCVFANSIAVAFPIPEEAPVITIVLPLRRCAMLDDILAICSCIMHVLRGRIGALNRAEVVCATRLKGRRRCMYVGTLNHGAIGALYRWDDVRGRRGDGRSGGWGVAYQGNPRCASHVEGKTRLRG
jgi:hypothetical protein